MQTNEVFRSISWKIMLGFEPHEIRDTFSEWETRVHPEDLPRAQAEVERHLKGHTTAYSSEYRIRCKDGTYKWILDQGKVMSRTPDRKPLRVIGTHSDISERKKAEQDIRESAERFAGIFQT